MVRHAGWTENLAGFQIPFRTSLQALLDPQESNSSFQWVWGFSKSYTGDRIPGQYCRCAVSTCMCSNGRQGGNGKPHQHQLHNISEPNSSTRENFGAFQATAGTTSPYQAKIPYTKRTALYQKTKDAKSKCYGWTHRRTRRLDHTSATCNFPKTGHQVGATFGDKMGGSEKWYE